MFKRYAKVIFGGIAAAVLAVALVGYAKRSVRYAVFAGYNGDGTIHPYVITYLKGLNEVADGVVYIADSTLKPEEEEKLKGLTIHYENVRHGEYDWGSYKRGFNWLKNNGYLEKADELIFANDSCYAPITSFKPMFQKMAKRKDLDFWGNTQNVLYRPHLQSYFLVFRKRVLLSKMFWGFLNGVYHLDSQAQYVAAYELKLTLNLAQFGYQWDSYQAYTKPATEETPDLNSYPLTMIKERGNQFLKRRTFTSNLEIKEDVGELLQYLRKVSPRVYQDITAELKQADFR